MSAPEEVTVTSTGSLRVDPSKLLQTAEAQAQLKALKGLNIGGERMRDECKHGSLRRKCEVCDLERQLSEALERGKALEDALQVAVDSELGAKWIWPDSAKETWMKNARELLSGDEPTYTDCPIHGRHEGDCPRC